jgi:hypothetical protein
MAVALCDDSMQSALVTHPGAATQRLAVAPVVLHTLSTAQSSVEAHLT